MFDVLGGMARIWTSIPGVHVQYQNLHVLLIDNVTHQAMHHLHTYAFCPSSIFWDVLSGLDVQCQWYPPPRHLQRKTAVRSWAYS
jgi:hypothetical protein